MSFLRTLLRLARRVDEIVEAFAALRRTILRLKSDNRAHALRIESRADVLTEKTADLLDDLNLRRAARKLRNIILIE